MGGGVILMRAWTDTTSADVPGLITPQQVRQLFDVITASQPLVEAAGSLPPPTSLTISYPTITQRPLVAEQMGRRRRSRRGRSRSWRRRPRCKPSPAATTRRFRSYSCPTRRTWRSRASCTRKRWPGCTDVAAYQAYTAVGLAQGQHRHRRERVERELFELAGLISTASRRFPNRLVLSTDLWVKIGGAVDADGRPLFTHTRRQTRSAPPP